MSDLNAASSETSGASPGGSDASDMRLHGRWLLLARTGWILVTLTIIILNIIAIPDLYASNFTFTPPMLQDLHRLGFSPILYGVLLSIMNASFQIIFLPLGLLLFLRRSDDRMALFCAFTLVTFGGGVTFFDFSSGGVEPTLAANPVLRVVALLLFGVGETSLVVFFYLFPSGRFVPRWTRWAALLVAAYYLAVIFFPTLPSNAGGPATFFIPVSLVVAVVAQVYRYLRVSTPRERQQTKWAVFGFVLAILIIAINFLAVVLLPSSFMNDPVLQNLNPVFTLSLPMIPIFIVIAILRERLWDIDSLINKALVYGSLTALLGALYAGLIIGLEALAGGITGGQASQNPIVLVVSTLAIYALFQPARRRIQNLIDRRFYRRKYDAEKTLAAFSATLRNEVDLEQVRAHLLAVVQETMQPTHVSLWLRQPERHGRQRGREAGE
jgi:hypothetical protein